MSDVSTEKHKLRARLRARRLAMSEVNWVARCRRIAVQLRQLPAVARAKRIASFWPMVERREVDLRPLHEWLRERESDVYYPFMRGEAHGFAKVEDVAAMEPTRIGFLQPGPEAQVARPGELEVILVPALGVTPKGTRLGYGAGFYDRLLPRFSPPAVTVAVVFNDEVLPELPREPHDRACDIVISDD